MNKKLLSFAFAGLLACYGTSANALQITLDDFTDDSVDAQMTVEILDSASGVTAAWAFSPLSANTGDITGIWLGINDAEFDTSTISAADVSVLTSLPSELEYTVSIGSGLNLGSGVNLNGESGFAVQFDFDLALKQVDGGRGNSIITDLLIRIATPGLTASMFDAAGARLQTAGSSGEGSSKLAGSVVSVPEPTTLSLLGTVLLVGGLYGRRKSKA